MLAYGLPAVCIVLLLKEAGIPIPIPGDVILLGAAAHAASGQWNPAVVIVTLEAAMLMGGTIQYLLARGPGRRLLYRVGRYVGLTPSRLERIAGALRRGGGPAVAVALITPGVRTATIAASGVADLPFATFFPALVIGDSIFFLLHVAIGYAGGQGLSLLLHGRHLAFGAVLLVGLGIVSILGLLLLRRTRRAGRTPVSAAETTGTWLETGCPICLAVSALHTPPV